MPKKHNPDPNQLSLFDLSLYNKLSTDKPSPLDSVSELSDNSENNKILELNSVPELLNISNGADYTELSSSSGSANKSADTEASPKERPKLFVPSRFDALERRAKHELKDIIVPVDDALARVKDTYSDIIAAGKGAFWVLRGSSGSGKSTFLHTLNLFLHEVEILSIQADESVPETLKFFKKSNLEDNSSLKKLRIIVIENREALTDFSVDQLEKDLHSINSFIRSHSGERSLIVWPCNADDLEQRLISLAERIGADSLLGIGEPSYRFKGPPKSQYLDIATRTIKTLNDKASLVDLGISEERAITLIQQADTIGKYLGLLRQELLNNEKNVEKLFEQEKCRMWTVVIAGNNPKEEVTALTHGGYSNADISCLMVSTKANIVQDLKKYSDKVGILGTVLDAQIVYLPIATARAIVIKYADPDLQEKMKQAGMFIRHDSKALERLMSSQLAKAFKTEPKGFERNNIPNLSSKLPFEKLLEISQKNDELLNRAIGEALKACGLASAYKTEVELRGIINIRSDLLCKTDSGLVRLEIMWTKWARRADIANYVLKKLQSYGKAIGLLE
ncbi:MAG TPA: hypothetical protein V6D28_04880 [Leptolyngbyaceae cyanobacterium]